MLLLKKLITSLILPPTSLLLLAFFGIWLASRATRSGRRIGLALVALSLLAVFLLSLPIVGNGLLASLEDSPPVTRSELANVQAIVILGGGMYFGAPEYGGDTVNSSALERLRFGARLARQSGLPILVSGDHQEAESMAAVLKDGFGVPVRWMERESKDTAGNAQLSAPILKQAGISRIALVSHGWHLPRAIPLFEREGFTVIAAPTGFSTGSPSLLDDLLPGRGLVNSRLALHEYLGRLADRIGKLYDTQAHPA